MKSDYQKVRCNKEDYDEEDTDEFMKLFDECYNRCS